MIAPLRSHSEKLPRSERLIYQVHFQITEEEKRILDNYCRMHNIQSRAELARTALENQIGKKFLRPRTACGHGRSREFRLRQEEAERS